MEGRRGGHGGISEEEALCTVVGEKGEEFVVGRRDTRNHMRVVGGNVAVGLGKKLRPV